MFLALGLSQVADITSLQDNWDSPTLNILHFNLHTSAQLTLSHTVSHLTRFTGASLGFFPPGLLFSEVIIDWSWVRQCDMLCYN